MMKNKDTPSKVIFTLEGVFSSFITITQKINIQILLFHNNLYSSKYNRFIYFQFLKRPHIVYLLLMKDLVFLLPFLRLLYHSHHELIRVTHH